AAFEMEINIVRTGMGVLQYLDTLALHDREEVAKDREAFQDFKAQYDRLTKNPDLGKRIAELYERFYTLGQSLMKNRERQQELFVALSQDSDQVDNILSKQLRPNIDPEGPDSALKVEHILTLKAQAASISAWMSHYRRTGNPDYDRRVVRHQQQFQDDLARF